MLKNFMKVGIGALTAALLGVLAVGLTADEILDRMDAEADALAEGSMVSIIKFHNDFADGTDNEYRFGSLSKPGFSLIFFIEPLELRGSVFLTHDAQEEGEGNRLWMYFPFFGSQPPKQLITEEDRSGSFADSSLSFEDIGDQDRRKDYDAVVLREEDLVVGDLTRTAYVIESTAKPAADVDTVRTVIWVDAEFFVMLKVESHNDLGNLDSTMEVMKLGEFEGKLTTYEMLATDVLEGSSTTITFLDRYRPDAEIPDEVFSVESVNSFDPTVWGF
jgi:hypothetical protein